MVCVPSHMAKSRVDDGSWTQSVDRRGSSADDQPPYYLVAVITRYCAALALSLSLALAPLPALGPGPT
jgi:hypothetical protein